MREGDSTMNKRIISLVLTLVLALSLTTPVLAATKPSTKTIKFQAGTNIAEGWSDDATIKVTNVTKQESKDFSVKLSDGKEKITFEGKKSKVIYCKTKTTITLVPNKDAGAASEFGIVLYSDAKTTKSVKSKIKFYSFYSESEEVDTSKKYDEVPEGDWVIADGSNYTVSKAGTYVLYVRPFGFYGTDKEDFELNPVFIVVE
jgi:hypothetical protein